MFCSFLSNYLWHNINMFNLYLNFPYKADVFVTHMDQENLANVAKDEKEEWGWIATLGWGRGEFHKNRNNSTVFEE
jgi:DNA recombination-dependent growth factor C